MMNLTNNSLTKRIRPDGSGYTVSAGTSSVNSDIVDTAGYNGVRFIIGFGALTSSAVTSVKVQQNTANSGTGMADLEGTSISIADTDDNKIAVTEIIQPVERYVRMATTRGTANAVIDFLLVELIGPRDAPVTQDSTVVSAETFMSPAEGTA